MSNNVNNTNCSGIPEEGKIQFRRIGRVLTDMSSGQSSPVYEYTSRGEAVMDLSNKVFQFLTPCNENSVEDYDHTTVFNSWINNTHFLSEKTTTQQALHKSGRRIWRVSREATWPYHRGVLSVTGTAQASSKKKAVSLASYNLMMKITEIKVTSQMDNSLKEYNQASYTVWKKYCFILDWHILNRIEHHKVLPLNDYKRIYGDDLFTTLPVCQMDKEKETVQGDVTQSSDKAHNTIITRDQTQSSATPTKALDHVSTMVSSEPYQDFKQLLDRWMPFKNVKITTAEAPGSPIKSWSIPEDLLTDKYSPNMLPFETFVYGKCDIEIKLVVNANRMQCGKALLSSKYDSYQAEGIQDTYQSALMRNHVIVDLSCNNEAVLNIPFRFHRPLMRLLAHGTASTGVKQSQYATLYLHMLSPLKAGPSTRQDIDLQLFYRIKSMQFTGMAYRIPTAQMGLLEGALDQIPTEGLTRVLKAAEAALEQLGRGNNQDKPSDMKALQVIPRPRLNFGTGKGLADTTIMRVNPYTITNHGHVDIPTDEPQDFKQLAQIWGIRNKFNWSFVSDPGTLLYEFIVDPTMRDYKQNYAGVPTPLEFACSNFMFWNGTIELRFDFVSCMFHTGSVQISVQYGRDAGTADQAACSYVKVFHLGDQKTVDFTIPYIYDTVYRRNTSSVYNTCNRTATNKDIKLNALTVAPLSNTKVKIHVINALRPVAAAPQEIEVLVFMRAGPNFSMYGLKPTTFIPEDTTRLRSFPKEFVRVVKNTTPVAQMDNGDKENLDTTHDFDSGISALTIQSSDVQTNFKDILRRPTLMIRKSKVTAFGEKSNGFFIPVMPPTRMLSSPNTNENTNIWNATIQYNPATNIMNMFRAWRGSSRYTIVAHGATNPFYVVFIPHTGTLIQGNHSLYINPPTSLIGAGFHTELVVPSINPTITLEVPYETENTWSLVQCKDFSADFAWRDHGDYNCGHIVIVSDDLFTVDVFWSAGDDFEIANFYGIHRTYNDDYAYRFDDNINNVRELAEEDRNRRSNTVYDNLVRAGKSRMNYPQPQMDGQDFPKRDTRTAVRRVVESPYVTTAISMVPVVGSPIASAITYNKISDKVENKLDKIVASTSKTSEDISATMEVANNSITTITEKIACVSDKLSVSCDAILNLVTNGVGQVGNLLGKIANGVNIVTNVILDILIAWIEKSWTMVAFAFVRLCSMFFIDVAMSSLMRWATKLGNYIKSMFENKKPNVQMDIEPGKVLGGILVGLVGTLVGCQLDATKERPFLNNLRHKFTSSSGISYLINILKFVDMTFGAIKKLIMEALGYVDPETYALQQLSGKSEIISQFIKESQLLLSESNKNMFMNPRFRARFWCNVLKAHQIQRLMSQVPNNCVSPVVGKYCLDVIRMGNEKFVDISASPVRYEPMVICIEGGSAVGKSFITEKVVASIMKAIKYSAPQMGYTYYRVPGKKFWSGYHDQPVIVYDEWLNFNDAQVCTEQLHEFFELKTTSLFIPDQANLELKNCMANPMIVFLLCNDAFPVNTISNTVTNGEAVLRRRDLVFRAERTTEWVGKDLRLNQPSDACEHLQFKLYKDSSDKNSLTTTSMNYTKFEKWVSDKFQKYHETENKFVKKRMAALPQFAANAASAELRVDDPFSLFYDMNAKITATTELSQNGWTPYDKLELACNQLINVVHEHQLNVEERDLPEVASFEEVATAQVHFMVPILLGVCMYPRVIKQITNASVKVLSGIERWILGKHKAQSFECTVCNEYKTCMVICKPSLIGKEFDDPTVHRVCLDCWTHRQTIKADSCKICGSKEVGPILTEDSLKSIGYFYRTIKSGTSVVKEFVHFFGDYFGEMPYEYLYDFIIMVCSTINPFFQMHTFLMATGRVLTHEAAMRYDAYMKACDKYDEYAPSDPNQPVILDLKKWEETINKRRLEAITSIKSKPNREDLLNPFYNAVDEEKDDFSEDINNPFGENYINKPTTSKTLTSAEVVEMLDTLKGDDLEKFLNSLDEDVVFSQMDNSDWDTPYVPARDYKQDLWLKGGTTDPSVGVTDPLSLLYTPKIDEYNFKMTRTTKPIMELPICPHVTMSANVACVRYVDNKWSVKLGSVRGEIFIEDTLCATNCAFQNEDTHRKFLEDYILTHTHGLTDLYRGWMNNRTNSGEYHLSKIPRALRPKWMVVVKPEEYESMVSKTWWEYISEKFIKYKRIIMILTGITASIASIVALYKWLSVVDDTPEPQSSEHENKVRHVVERRELRRVRDPTSKPHFQACADPAIEAQCREKIGMNTMRLTIYRNEDPIRQLCIVGLYNHYAIMPRHFVREIEDKYNEGCYFKLAPIYGVHQEKFYNFDRKDFVVSTTTDLAYMRVPSSFNMFKDIRSMCAKDEDLTKVLPATASLMLVPSRHQRYMREICVDLIGLQHKQTIQDVDGTSFTALDVVVYNYSQPGACSSMLLLPRTQRPICSLHIAGIGSEFNGEGYGVIITQEAIGELMASKGVAAQFDDTDLEPIEHAKMFMDEKVNVAYLGSLKQEEIPYIPSKTKLRKSLLHGKEGLTTDHEPAILRKDDPRYVHSDTPLLVGCSKHGKLSEDFKSSQVERARNLLWDGWYSQLKPIILKPKKLTYSEACVGLQTEYYEPMDLNTSAGYPYMLNKGKTSKKDYITYKRNEALQPIGVESMDDDLLKTLVSKEVKRRKGIVPITPFIDTLKDEKKRTAKCRKLGGTRVFCNPPVDYTIALRQNFMHFVAAFMSNRMRMMHSIGINAKGDEWTLLAKNLLAVSENIVTIDYSNFGPGFNAMVSRAAADIMKRWVLTHVENVHELELDCLLEECIHSVHIMHNTVYQQVAGSPSGAAITSIMNSLVNQIYMLIAWDALTVNKVKRSISTSTGELFKKNVCMFVYGDDLIMSVSDEYIDIYNATTITEFFSKYKIVATDATKGDVVVPFTKLYGAQFLKRGFRKHPNRDQFLSPLELESILSTTQWVWESPNIKLATEENCKAAVLEMHGHGKGMFEDFKTLVNKYLTRAKCSPITLQWEEIDKGFYDDHLEFKW